VIESVKGAHYLSASQRPCWNARSYTLSGCAMGAVLVADYGIRLGTFLAFNDIELDLIALFEGLVSIQLDC